MSEAKCDACGTNPYPVSLKKCSYCKSTAYCDATCQRAHWSKHKKECKRIKRELEESVKRKAIDAIDAAKKVASSDSEDVKIIAHNERVILSRTKDKSDGHCYSHFMPGKEYGDFITSNRPPCWCAGVGQEQSLLVVFPFDPKDLKNRGGYAKSQYLNTPFEVNFQIHVSEILGNISVDLSEEPKAGVSLDTSAGVNCRATYFFLKGVDATQITLPPPSKGKFKRSGVQVANSHMAIWPGVGMKQPLGLHETKLIPSVDGKALRDSGKFSGDTADLADRGCALVMMIENCGVVSGVKEFETASISSQLHKYHSDARPEDEIPNFSKEACRMGVFELNMKQPVNMVGMLPADKPSPEFEKAKPKGMDDLSAGALTMIQNVMTGLQSGQPNLGQIEEVLGDKEAGPVLQNILGSPQMAPLMAKLMASTGVKQGGEGGSGR